MGKDSALAGAAVIVILVAVYEIWGFRSSQPGFEAALVVLLSWAYSHITACRRPKV